MTNLTIPAHKHPLYNVWSNMRKRCLFDWHPRYPAYGGRGIKICARWADFWTFVADMPPRPSPQHSIDRIDVNGDYTPDNCRWATSKQQAENRQDSIATVFEGQRMLVRDVAPMFGHHPNVVYKRLSKGWPVGAALYWPTGTVIGALPKRFRASWSACFPEGTGDGHLRDAA